MSELKEKFAAIEHERWADWQAYVFTQCKKEPLHVELTIPASLVRRWRRQIETPYADLTEEEKQSDRDQVDRYWHLITALQQDLSARQVQVEELQAALKQISDHVDIRSVIRKIIDKALQDE